MRHARVAEALLHAHRSLNPQPCTLGLSPGLLRELPTHWGTHG